MQCGGGEQLSASKKDSMTSIQKYKIKLGHHMNLSLIYVAVVNHTISNTLISETKQGPAWLGLNVKESTHLKML